MTKKEWSLKFSKKLIEKMKIAGLNQKELAKLANISETTISRYISGSRIPNATVVINLAKALQCSTMELIQFGEIVI